MEPAIIATSRVWTAKELVRQLILPPEFRQRWPCKCPLPTMPIPRKNDGKSYSLRGSRETSLILPCEPNGPKLGAAPGSARLCPVAGTPRPRQPRSSPARAGGDDSRKAYLRGGSGAAPGTAGLCSPEAAAARVSSALTRFSRSSDRTKAYPATPHAMIAAQKTIVGSIVTSTAAELVIRQN